MAHISKIINEKTYNLLTTEIQMIFKRYYKEVYDKKFGNLEEMDKLVEVYNISKPNQEEIQNLSRSITSNEMKAVI